MGNIYTVLPAEIRNGRPDSVTHIDQITIGAILVNFKVFHNEDLHAKEPINPFGDLVALVLGAAGRVTGDIVEEHGSKYAPIEKISTFSHIPENHDAPFQGLWGAGIIGIETEESELKPWMACGLLIAREEPYADVPSLEFAPGLYVNGANDEATIVQQGHYAIALDRHAQKLGQWDKLPQAAPQKD